MIDHNKEQVFFVTSSSEDEARKLARYLVEKKRAACVNIIKLIISIYRWEDSIEENDEFLLVIKTTKEKSEDLIHAVENIHSYETPECIGLNIEAGSVKYLEWLRDAVK